MHILRLDIDRKNSAEHLHVGPLGCGMNAVFSPAQSGSEIMARFVRCLVFRGRHSLSTSVTDSPLDPDEVVDGAIQWVDATGHVRMISNAAGSPDWPNRFLFSPVHPSERPIHADDLGTERGLGNISWEGNSQDVRWDELRNDVLGMIFCSPLGCDSPEKLWWAASRLGVHAPAKSELDEGYQRLKAEEQELLERLRHVENVDHDRAWWSLERDRILAEITHIHNSNSQLAGAPGAVETENAAVAPLRERLVSIQLELSKLRARLQELVIEEANAKLEPIHRDEHRLSFSNLSLNPTQNDSVGYGPYRPTSGPARFDCDAERKRIQTRIEQLIVEQANTEVQLRSVPVKVASVVNPSPRWDDSQLRQQLAHAEEMIRRWDRRTQAHRRLAEVQSHLRTRSPYRRTSEGSLMPLAEKYLRELTNGAVRHLPPWAVEASYLNRDSQHGYAFEHDSRSGFHSGYRSEYYDRGLPAENTRQRKLVDLAIRLAIAEAAVPRIGRIPMMLDHSINAFRGEALERILHVLATFARDGRQLIVSTQDEYTARRIAAHGGTVCRLQEELRYARPGYVMDGYHELGLHPSLEQSPYAESFVGPQEAKRLRLIGQDLTTPYGVSPRYGYEDLGELNRQLTGLANEHAIQSWWHPEAIPASHARYVEPVRPFASASRAHLELDSVIEQAPGIDLSLARRLHHVGIYRVRDLLNKKPSSVSAAVGLDADSVARIQSMCDLMCGTPQLRPFDAKVLVGCGIPSTTVLKSIPVWELVERVESFLDSVAGQDLVRRANSNEVARISNWLADMKRSQVRRRSKDRDRSSNVGPRRNARMRGDWNSEGNARGTAPVRPRVMRETSKPAASSDSARPERLSRTNRNSSSSNGSHWKFYLDIDSPIVDAPSIGPKMAEKLAPLNVLTVGDLIASDAGSIADQLAERNVSRDIVEQWQQQAMLVCRIPNLRGHDAQMLVGAGYTTAEVVAASSASSMLEKVLGFASTKAGTRLLRGSPAPDASEVAHWIEWSQNCRAVRAA